MNFYFEFNGFWIIFNVLTFLKLYNISIGSFNFYLKYWLLVSYFVDLLVMFDIVYFLRFRVDN